MLRLGLRRTLRALRLLLPDPPHATVFGRIYQQNAWGNAESCSGPGSTLDASAQIREALTTWMAQHGIARVLDVPCGDFNWMRALPLECIDYTGGDIVPGIISENARRHAAPGRCFVVLDLARDPLPAADLCIVRDALVHFRLADAARALENLRRAPVKFLAVTHFPAVRENSEIVTGQWRPLNLCAAPFHWPEPVELLWEYAPPGLPAEHRKALGIWRGSLAHMRGGD